MEQNYHEFANPDSIFYLLERQGALRHRVADAIAPGGEPEPYVPDTATRGRARARFIREHAGQRQIVVDWGTATDFQRNRCCRLPEPFAQNYGPWEEAAGEFSWAARRVRRDDPLPEPQIIELVQQAYERGAYETAHRRLAQLEARGRRPQETTGNEMLRYRAWIQSRRGRNEGVAFLDAIYGGHVVTTTSVADYLSVYRFRSLDFPPEIESWLECSRGLLHQADANAEEAPEEIVLREHLAYAMIRKGQFQEAVSLLEPVQRQAAFDAIDPRIQGRLMATLGDAYRLLGRSWRARGCLRRADELLDPQRFLGERADFVCTGLAKLTQNRQRVLAWLASAKEAQTSLGNCIGLRGPCCWKPAVAATPPRPLPIETALLPFAWNCRRWAVAAFWGGSWNNGAIGSPRTAPAAGRTPTGDCRRDACWFSRGRRMKRS